MRVFENCGVQNTDETLKLALQTARERGIGHIVVASGRGETALKLIGNDDLNVVCVAYNVDVKEPPRMDEQTHRKLKDGGVTVYHGPHLFAGIERGYVNLFQGFGPAYVTAQTLRMFGQGTKVAVEIAVTALDAGLIPGGEDVIAIAGTGRAGGGADTALIIRPANSNAFTETVIREHICKPANI